MTKPYLFTCCSSSLCKICKVSKVDLPQRTQCLFCDSVKFKLQPNIQAFKCIQSVLTMKSADPLKNEEEKVNKFQIWKNLNEIYYNKMKNLNYEKQIKEEEKSKMLQKWMKQLLTGKFCIIKSHVSTVFTQPYQQLTF